MGDEGGTLQCPEEQRGEAGVDKAREADAEQTPLSEEMCFHSHFPTCGAREKGGETGGSGAGRCLGLWVPSTLTRGPKFHGLGEHHLESDAAGAETGHGSCDFPRPEGRERAQEGNGPKCQMDQVLVEVSCPHGSVWEGEARL